MATGDPWNCLIPFHFGGGISQWSEAFEWFINHIFILFYNKISGTSLQKWAGEMDEFRRIIHTKLTSPPCELERWANIGLVDDELGLFLVDIPFESFLCGMLLDDTSIRTNRPGSGPHGDYVMAP